MNTRLGLIVAILAAGALIGGSLAFTGGTGLGGGTGAPPEVSNVSIENGVQIITIKAKGGYWPRATSAKAGVPTVLKLYTQGTYDCSQAVSIPSLGFRKNLPATGEVAVDVPAQEAGFTLRGLCSMGMYNFAVNFN